MSKISHTEDRFNQITEQIKNLTIIPGARGVFHLHDCDKQEVKDLGAKLNVNVIKPEDNLFANTYTLKVDILPNVQLLVHSNEVIYEKIEKDCVMAPLELPNHESCGVEK